MYLLVLVLFWLLPVRVQEGCWLGVLMLLGPPAAYFVPWLVLAVWALVAREWRGLALQGATAVAIVGLYMDCRLHWPRATLPGDVVVVNYNVHGLVAGAEKVTNALREMGPDVLLLQEATGAPDCLPALQTAFPGWHWARAKLHPEMLIGSRFPLLEAGREFNMGAGCRTGLMARVRMPDGRVVNLVDVHFSVSLVGRSLSSSGSKTAYLLHTARVRQQQTETLLGELERLEGPVLVAGDFNSTPLAYPIGRLRGRLGDAFAEAGLGVGLTFDEGRRLWRIDYLFKSADWETIRCEPISCGASDHLALRSVLRWRDFRADDSASMYLRYFVSSLSTKTFSTSTPKVRARRMASNNEGTYLLASSAIMV